MTWIHEQPNWPNFYWDTHILNTPLAAVRTSSMVVCWAEMENLGFALREEANLNALSHEAVKSSAIEGEQLNLEEVRSSIARRLGMEQGGEQPSAAMWTVR
ncbi:MAG: DUF4172 domain-containing protein [Thiolinea sp.]